MKIREQKIVHKLVKKRFHEIDGSSELSIMTIFNTLYMYKSLICIFSNYFLGFNIML